MSNTREQDVILVLAKRPELGRAKTRLARTIGEDAALRLAEAFTRDSLDVVSRLQGATSAVSFTPKDARSWFEALAPAAILSVQADGDLGARLTAAFRAAFEGGATRVVAIGTDTPHLTPERLSEALDALQSSDVCLGPARDGGYYLIGMSRLHHALFEDVPWSTADVLTVTRTRAESCGLSVHELAPETDVDDASALEELRSTLQEDPALAPTTRAVLCELDGPAP